MANCVLLRACVVRGCCCWVQTPKAVSLWSVLKRSQRGWRNSSTRNAQRQLSQVGGCLLFCAYVATPHHYTASRAA